MIPIGTHSQWGHTPVGSSVQALHLPDSADHTLICNSIFPHFLMLFGPFNRIWKAIIVVTAASPALNTDFTYDLSQNKI